MSRWQFEPRYGHNLDMSRARAIVADLQPREAFPIMKGPEKVKSGPNKGDERFWVGTNQPRTITFSGTEEQALAARKVYGLDHVFVRDRKTFYAR